MHILCQVLFLYHLVYSLFALIIFFLIGLFALIFELVKPDVLTFFFIETLLEDTQTINIDE